MLSDPICWGTSVLCFPRDFPHLFLKAAFSAHSSKAGAVRMYQTSFPASVPAAVPLPAMNHLKHTFLNCLRMKAHLFSWSHKLILAVWQPSLKWKLGCESVQRKEVSSVNGGHRQARSRAPLLVVFSCDPRNCKLPSFLGELQQNIPSVCTPGSNATWPLVFRSLSLQLTQCWLSNGVKGKGHNLLSENSWLCFGSSLGLMLPASFSRAHWLHVFPF